MGRVTERDAERMLELDPEELTLGDILEVSAMCRDYVPTGPALEGIGPRCRRCGCSEFLPCPGGCAWVERDLCNRCI
jgi:hypothetical protein